VKVKGVTVVCPVHNEEAYIPRTFPSIYALKPDQVLVLLDRCTDNSRRLIEQLNPGVALKIVEIGEEDGADWRFRSAYLRRLAYSLTETKFILNTAADIVLDEAISSYVPLLDNRMKLVRIGFLDYPYTLKCFMRQVYSVLTPFQGYGGLCLFEKTAWEDSEDLASLKQQKASEDSHLQISIEQKYLIKHRNSRSLHLRHTETSRDDYNRGDNYWNLVRAPWWKVLAIAVAMLRPNMMVGYLHAKNRD